MNFNNKIIQLFSNSFIAKLLMKDVILLNSNPPMCDNAYYVYKEILNRKLNDKFKLVWIVSKNNEKCSVNEKNVLFVSKEQKLKYSYYRIFSKYIMDCNPFILKTNKYQTRIYLSHSCPVKELKELHQSGGHIDYLISCSSFWNDIWKKLYSGSNLVKEYVIAGLPRNDTFFDRSQWKILFPEIEREKTILWLPTYRNHKTKRNFEQYTDIHFPLGLPCLDDIEQVKELNNYLKEAKSILVIKPHPAQDLTEIKELDFSNIKLIDNSYFEEDTTLYNYLPSIDALITDYSSVYWDFLLADKPVGLAIPDFEQYTQHIKIPYDYEKCVIGIRILSYNDLRSFIKSVVNNEDLYKSERNKNLSVYHKYVDGNASKRVVDLFEDIISKKKDKDEKSN